MGLERYWRVNRAVDRPRQLGVAALRCRYLTRARRLPTVEMFSGSAGDSWPTEGAIGGPPTDRRTLGRLELVAPREISLLLLAGAFRGAQVGRRLMPGPCPRSTCGADTRP